VGIFFGHQGESPENGSFPGFGWRLLGMFGSKSSNIGLSGQRADLIACKTGEFLGPYTATVWRGLIKKWWTDTPARASRNFVIAPKRRRAFFYRYPVWVWIRSHIHAGLINWTAP
jgi:hypothetical protein